MNNHPYLHIVMVCAFAFFGAMVANGFFNARVTSAALNELAQSRTLIGHPPSLGIQAKTANGAVIKYIFGTDRSLRLDQGVFQNQPITDFAGEGYKLRLQMGMYPGDVRSNETGLPAVTLYNHHEDLKELFRLDGGNQAPLVIFKSHEANRLIFGLSLNDPAEEPFLAYFDRHGAKHMLFGNF